jgi:hypothetical protein
MEWEQVEDFGCLNSFAKTLGGPVVKQHLAAIGMLFDWLIGGGIIAFNPAASVRGPKHVAGFEAPDDTWFDGKRRRCLPPQRPAHSSIASTSAR